MHFKISHELGEYYKSRYRVIYNTNETDFEKMYTFKEINPRLSEILIKIKMKRKEKDNWIFSKAYALILAAFFPISYFVVKKIVFPFIPF